jgi:hypothetical protein
MPVKEPPKNPTGDSGSIKGDDSGSLSGKQVALELILMGRLGNTSPKVSFKDNTSQFSYLGATPSGKGAWKLMFKTSFSGAATPLSLRVDLEESGIHVLAVTALWNPLLTTPIVVRL